MNVSLTPELESLVQHKVEGGLYRSASEVVREALRLLGERDELRDARLAQLRQDLHAGIEQLDRGEAAPLDVEQIKRRGRERLARG